MKFIFFADILPYCWPWWLGAMLVSFFLGWLFHKLFNKNIPWKQKYEEASGAWQTKLGGLEASLSEKQSLHTSLQQSHDELKHKLSGSLSDIQHLTTQLNTLKSKPPEVIEKIVEKRVEVPVEKIVEKKVEDTTKITLLQNEMATLKKQLDDEKNRPPKEVIVEKIVEKKIEDTAKLTLFQTEVGELKKQLEAEKNKPAREVVMEKRIEVPVEKIVEKKVEDTTRINLLQDEMKQLKVQLEVERNKPPREVVVDKIVEKKVEDTARIYLLQNEMTELKRQFEVEKNKPPREVIVEKRIEVPVEKIVEKNVEDISRIFMLQNEIAELNKKLGERKTRPVRKQEVKRKVYRVAKTDYKMYSGIYGKKIVADDLKLVEGIGPVIEKLFHASGLKTWKQVANTKAEKLKEILDKGGRRFQVHNPATWPAQCQMMVDDKWEELKVYQDKLNRGKE